MTHTFLLAAVAALAAALASFPLQALAVRHVLGSPNALNVSGRRYATEDGLRPPEPEGDATEDRFRTPAAFFGGWLASRFSRDSRKAFDAATAAENDAWDAEIERAVGERWWDGGPLMELVRHDRARSRDAIMVASVASVASGASVMASPLLSGVAGWQAWPYVALWGVLAAALAVGALTDWRHYVLPHATNLVIAGCALAMVLLRSWGEPAISPWIYLGTGFALLALFAAFEFLGKSGGGDTKIIVGIGFLLGPWVLFTLLYASVLAIAYGAVFARHAERGKDVPESETGSLRRKKIPYGPFLAMGLLISMLTFPLNTLIFQGYLGLLSGL